jgi:hypothetical protein
MKRESRTVDRSDQVDSLTQPSAPRLQDLQARGDREFHQLGAGIHEEIEDDARRRSHVYLRPALSASGGAAGLANRHRPDRGGARGPQGGASSAGVCADGEEVPLPTFRPMANEDPLNRRVVEQMLVGGRRASMRAVSKLLSAAMVSRGVSKSAVSRRFVAKTAAQLAAWRSTALDGLDLVALLVNGVHIGEHCIIVALGLDTT